MKIDWKVSIDNKKAILNGGDLEVEIICGFSKIESGNIYECFITSNKLENIFDNLDIEAASKLIPNLWSNLGDIYEE